MTQTAVAGARMACAAFLLCLCFLGGALGHGGGVHPYLYDTNAMVPGASVRSYIHVVAATCSSFAPLTVSAGAIPFFNGTGANVNITGSINLGVYLSNNCSDVPTAYLTPVLQLNFDNGEPYGNVGVFGYGFTGPCSAPGDLYRNNASAGDDRFNLLWWNAKEGRADASGLLWGAAPNTFMVRPGGLNSVVVLPDGANPMCCNMQWMADPTTVVNEAEPCYVSPPPPSPSPSPSAPSPSIPSSPTPPSPPHPKKTRSPPPSKKHNKHPPPPKKKNNNSRRML